MDIVSFVYGELEIWYRHLVGEYHLLLFLVVGGCQGTQKRAVYSPLSSVVVWVEGDVVFAVRVELFCHSES